MFLIFIGDLGEDMPDTARSTVLKYVDDTKLLAMSSSPEDVKMLEVLYNWQKTNNMSWNHLKFQHLRCGANQELREETLLFTPEMTDIIPQEEELKDLGIQMDMGADFKAHRRKAIKKTKQKCGWVLRSFRTRSPGPMRTLWRSLCQPHQDYGSQLWSPVGLVGDIADQEGPLRSFSRKVQGLGGQDYWKRLQSLNLSSTERRSERYKALYTWKMIHGYVPDIGIQFATDVDSRLGLTLRIPKKSGSRVHVQTLKDQSFMSHGPRIFNSLPKCVRAFKGSKEAFKSLLDKFLCEVPDQPNVPGYRSEAVTITGRASNSLPDWARIRKTAEWTSPTMGKNTGGGILP